jgi:ABC-type Fe3+ transport system permease subunit
MSDVEIFLALAAALTAVWLGLLVAILLWLGRRMAARVRDEFVVIIRGLRLRTKTALLDGVGAFATLSWLLAAALAALPLLLILGPLLLAIAGLDLTAHIVKVGP